MTFAEADAQYEVLKQQFLAGALDENQFDEQLHRLMVLDDAGVWWAKSRESGAWHYYDSSSGDWVAAVPPASSPAVPPPPFLPSAPSTALYGEQHPKTADPPTGGSQPPTGSTAAGASAGSAVGAGGGDLPRWAAVKPAASASVPTAWGASSTLPSGGHPPSTTSTALPSTSQGAPATASYNARDFGPIAELTGGMKVLFYILALLLPILGLILYFVYRNKPAQSDRTAARAFLILGIASIVFSCMCSTTFFLLESAVLGTGTKP